MLNIRPGHRGPTPPVIASLVRELADYEKLLARGEGDARRISCASSTRRTP